MTCGVDIVKIERIERSIKKERFLREVYSPGEIELINKKGTKTAAGNYAAKEAFSKALGTGIRGFSLNEVSVLRNEEGAPYFEFSGNAAALTAGKSFQCSISHDGEYAIAFVVGE